MDARAKMAAEKEREIMKATVELWLSIPLHEITLEKVAERSGVTVRTILRKFGSKEGLLEACLEQDAGQFETARNEAAAGDVPEILSALISEYEIMGEAVIRTLAIEDSYQFANKLLDRGRAFHRQWCEKVFGPVLPPSGSPAYQSYLTAFIASTEIYLWKLMRKDLGLSTQQTREIFEILLTSLIYKIKKDEKTA